MMKNLKLATLGFVLAAGSNAAFAEECDGMVTSHPTEVFSYGGATKIADLYGYGAITVDKSDLQRAYLRAKDDGSGTLRPDEIGVKVKLKLVISQDGRDLNGDYVWVRLSDTNLKKECRIK